MVGVGGVRSELSCVGAGVSGRRIMFASVLLLMAPTETIIVIHTYD